MVFGDWNTLSESNCNPLNLTKCSRRMEVSILSRIVHEHFDPTSLNGSAHHNIALLKLRVEIPEYSGTHLKTISSVAIIQIN